MATFQHCAVQNAHLSLLYFFILCWFTFVQLEYDVRQQWLKIAFDTFFLFSEIGFEFWYSFLQYFSCHHDLQRCTDKRIDACSRHFIIWKINSGLLAVDWAWLWKKGFGLIMTNFRGPVFFKVFMGKILIWIFFWKYCNKDLQ